MFLRKYQISWNLRLMNGKKWTCRLLIADCQLVFFDVGFLSTFTSENFYNENIAVTIDFTGFSGYPDFACYVMQFAAVSFTANIPSKEVQLPEFQITQNFPCNSPYSSQNSPSSKCLLLLRERRSGRHLARIFPRPLWRMLLPRYRITP